MSETLHEAAPATKPAQPAAAPAPSPDAARGARNRSQTDAVLQLRGPATAPVTQTARNTAQTDAALRSGLVLGHEDAGSEHTAESAEAPRDGRHPIASPASDPAGAPLPPAVSAQIEAQRGGGSPLPKALGGELATSFGADVGALRVHADGTAAALAGQLGARAFSVGHDLFFASGQYAPETPEGQALIRHEVSHALGEGASSRTVRRKPYASLGGTQRAQVDAVSESLFYDQAPKFEKEMKDVGKVTSIAVDAAEALKDKYPTLRNKNLDVPGVFAAVLAKGATPRALPVVTGTQSESIAQTKALAAQTEPDGSEKETPKPEKRATREDTADEPDAVGAIRHDSAYAAQARAAQVDVRGTASTGAASIFQIAKSKQLDAHAAGFRLGALGWQLGAHTVHEIMISWSQVFGQPYLPGPMAARQAAAPLDERAFGRLFPDHFVGPAFKLLLADALFPKDPAEAKAALDAMPADARASVTKINEHFVGSASDAQLAPLVQASVPRVLVERIGAAGQAVLAGLLDPSLAIWTDWPTCKASPKFAELVAAVAEISHEEGEEEADGRWHAELVFASLFVKHNKAVNPEATRLALVAETMTGRPVADDPGRAGYEKAELTAAGKRPKETLARYGAKDRGVDLALPPKAVSKNQLAAIHSYSKDPDDDDADNFERIRGATNDPKAATEKDVGRLRSTVSGLQQLPAYRGPVYRSVKSQTITEPADLASVHEEYGPGSIVADKLLYSGSKTVRDNTMFGKLNLAFVIDGVKTGRDVQLMSASSAEREVVFAPSARFVVTRHEDAIKRGVDDKFESGHYWIHMRELDPSEPVPPPQPAPPGFSEAFQLEVKGRRAIDRKDYNVAKQHFDSGTPANAANSPGVYSPPPNQLTPPEKFYDYDKDVGKSNGYFAKWQTAEKFTREQMPKTPPITVKHLTDLQAGLGDSGLRTKKAHDVVATGGYDIDGKETDDGKLFRIPKARYDAVLVNHPHLIVEKKKDIGGDTLCSIAYPESKHVGGKLDTFVADVNQRYTVAAAKKDAARNKAGVQLAAWAQQTLSAIHPFGDANGRVTRLIMDYLLAAFDLPPSLLGDVEMDYLMTEKEWAGQVASGIKEHQALETRYLGAHGAHAMPDGVAELETADEHPRPGAPTPVVALVQLINLNTADLVQLMQLPGIGQKRADAIRKHRRITPFTKVEDIVDVPGIGPGLLNAIKTKATV